MQVLIQGADGRMGRLYSAIVRYLGHEDIPWDIKSIPHALIPHLPGVDHDTLDPAGEPVYRPDYSCVDAVIIATPPATHVELIQEALEHGKPVLCEKPLSKDVRELERLVSLVEANPAARAYMVNNWAFAVSAVGGPVQPGSVSEIQIDNYFTGADGVWDLIQPLFLLKDPAGLTVRNSNPVPEYIADGRVYNTVDFQKSYVTMVAAFLKSITVPTYRANLWPVDRDLLELHRRVYGYTYEQFGGQVP